jgi:hypothetical protein
MAAPLEVGKVILGAFLVPWRNRGAFGRALAIPLLSLVTLSLSWYYAGAYLPTPSTWLLLLLYGVLFVFFAVTCHRLVLLDPHSVASRIAPRWSWRESRFLFWMVAVWLIGGVVALALITLGANIFLWSTEVPAANVAASGHSDAKWFDWAVFVAKVPALYMVARLCVLFPATAVDRKVNLKWAWRLTENSGWRLFLVVAVLPWLISELVSLVYRKDASVIETIILTFVGSALFAAEIAALSLSYRELTK